MAWRWQVSREPYRSHVNLGPTVLDHLRVIVCNYVLGDNPKRGPSPLWGVVAFLEIARHAQERNPVSMKQKIAERKRLKCVIRRHFRKRIISQD